MNEEMEYGKYMRDGEWCESKGDSYFSQGYYSDAKSWYYRAKENYDKAYDIAYKSGHMLTYAASDASRRVEKAYQEAHYQAYKDWSLF